jgi:hypothetical protein
MTLDDILDKIPSLLALRSDVDSEQLKDAIREAAIAMAMDNRLFTKEYRIDLQCCTGDYLLEECEVQPFLIESVCLYDCALDQCGNNKPQCTQLSPQLGEWCQVYGTRFRFVPPSKIEIKPVDRLSGVLSVTAATHPNYDACSIPDEYFTTYGRLFRKYIEAYVHQLSGKERDSGLAQLRGQEAIRLGTRAFVTKYVSAPTLITTQRKKRFV